ncbi:MAG: tRNA 2-thiouridine(34) synthase MnmA, partial [Anaerolineae bacterium]
MSSATSHRRVAVALSGGVDSAVSAALLLEQGYDVIGLGMRLPRPEETLVDAPPGQESPAMADAARIAETLGVPFTVLDWRREFNAAIIEPFCAAYARGQTPNPCVWCNQQVKFGLLLAEAQRQRADYLATGHYARVSLEQDWPVLTKGADLRQDQSYFLYAVATQALRQVLFPLGNLTKAEVRRMAAERGLPVAEKKGSQDICFVSEQGYTALLARRAPAALEPGDIIDTSGRILGRHRGLGSYTIGQREGLGIAAPQPLYVTAIDTGRNALVVAPRGETFIRALELSGVRWLLPESPSEPFACRVRTRYRAAEQPAEVQILPDGRAQVVFSDPQPPAAPGQSAVLYQH